MKAQILKIAGVKTEAEFYKKFPSEEAFMKKHGKELKKAQYGTYVAGQPEQAQQKPLMYDDLYQDTMASITGVSKEERARQEGLAAMSASDSSSSQGGFGDILKNIDPQMISSAMSAIGGAKNGKRLKKAQGGAFVPTDPVIDLDYQMPSDKKPTGETGNFAFGRPSDLIPELNSKNQLKTPSSFSGKAKDVLGALSPQLGSIIGAFEQIEQNKKDIKKGNQWAQISELAAQAALSKPEQSKRRYVRPEDNLVTGMNPLGKKDSLLAAQNGAEIQNTYSPGDLYSDLGYEPLNDSNIKQYARGGHIRKAAGGINLDPFAGAAGSLGGALGSATGKGTGKGGPGSTIGSAIGGIAGSFIPIPGIGTALGSLAGGFIGGLFDSEDQNKLQEAQDRQAAAVSQATMSKGISNLQETNKAFMKNGGYMNPEYNPQVIAKFGDYSMDQLLAPPHDADMLRAGGHLKEYTPPSARAMYTGRDLPYQMEYGGQMAMGGDLQVHRGEAETISYNPFLPDGGETIMFRGPSHDNGGMPISFGENGVEVEGGEPAVKLQDGGSPDGNLVVFGNMVIPEYGVAELGDKNAKGKKFKHYVDDLSKVEAKQSKLIDRATQLINDADLNDQFDKLSLNTGQANLIGTTMKLKDIAEKKKTAAAVQNAILDTASEMGVESDALAKGKIKYAKANDPYAKFGAKMETAQDGKSIAAFIKELPFAERKQIAKANGIKDFTGTPNQNKKLMGILNQVASVPGAKQPVTLATIPEALPSSYIPGMNSVAQQATQQIAQGPFIPGISQLPAQARQQFDIRNILPQSLVPPKMNAADVPFPVTYSKWDPQTSTYPMPNVRVDAKKLKPTQAAAAAKKAVDSSSADVEVEEEKAGFPWDDIMMGVNSVLPFLRPSNQIPLDPSQLSGELYALSQNQEEPVFAQSYQPMLNQATSISLQDQINEITAQARSAERMAQGDPSALAMIASQAAQAKNKVLGEQFRMNQGEAQRVAEGNRQTLNEAQKMNLGLFDQQQQRQSQARSNTKMQNIVALNSINDKILKQKAENRQVGLMENMYNYRFSPSGVAYNLNPLQNFNVYGSGTSGKGKGLAAGKAFNYDDAGQIVGIRNISDDTTKNSRNGSIVKAIKGL